MNSNLFLCATANITITALPIMILKKKKKLSFYHLRSLAATTIQHVVMLQLHKQ